VYSYCEIFAEIGVTNLLLVELLMLTNILRLIHLVFGNCVLAIVIVRMMSITQIANK